MGDQTAYRYQNTDTSGDGGSTYIYQNVAGLPGSQPVTFSVWIESNTPSTQDVEIAILDLENGGWTYQPCYATSSWQRCRVTTPSNTNSVQVSIGNSPWPWDVSIWGAQVESSSTAGTYVSTASIPATAAQGFGLFQVGFFTWETNGLVGNSDSITAVYSGDSNYTGSTSTSYIQQTQNLQTLGYCTAAEPTLCGIYILEDASIGTPYSTTLGAVGGTPPYTWTMANGTLPTGLSLSAGGTISGTPTGHSLHPSGLDGLGVINTQFDAMVTDSSTPPNSALKSYQLQLSGLAICAQHPVRNGECVAPYIESVYPNQPTDGTNNQQITLYGCVPNGGVNGFGSLTLNTPLGVTQVGGLTPTFFESGVMIQGTVNIAPNAPVGTPASPPQIGLNQVLEGCNENSNTIPYYMTLLCPSSVSLAFIGNEPLEDLFSRYLTGIGAYTEMQLNPTTTNWDGKALIYEMLSPVSNSCSNGTLSAGNICHYQESQFRIGYGGYLKDLMFVPAMENIFYDEHTSLGSKSMLNTLGLNSCAATCTQQYYCTVFPLSAYSINYNYTMGDIGGVPVTRVSVTKTQIGEDPEAEKNVTKH